MVKVVLEGHGWGAQHDPAVAECTPASNGNYLMYQYAVMGYEPNNNVSTELSIGPIASLQALGSGPFNNSNINNNIIMVQGHQHTLHYTLTLTLTIVAVPE